MESAWPSSSLQTQTHVISPQQQRTPRRRRFKTRNFLHTAGLVAFLWCFLYTLSALHNQHGTVLLTLTTTTTTTTTTMLPSLLHLMESGQQGSSSLNLNLPWIDVPDDESVSYFSNSRYYESSSLSSSSSFLWESSSILPAWMKEYFKWHHEQRLLLNATNWNDTTSSTSTNNHQFRYLVMRCLHKDKKCGGASDRIQSIPFALLLAYKMRRLLLIQWERPHKLEEFLVPPTTRGGVIGMDWRVPDFITFDYRRFPHIGTSAQARQYVNNAAAIDWRVRDFLSFDYRQFPKIITLEHAKRHLNSVVAASRNRTSSDINDLLLLDMRHQGHDHGSDFYNEHAKRHDEPSFDQVYRECWTVLFQPSPPVLQMIETRMLDLGLRAGQYTSLHIRSLYTHNRQDNINMVRNAVQCASVLQATDNNKPSPGDPNARSTIFVTSDSAKVTRRAVEWSRVHGKHVVAIQDDEDQNDDNQDKNSTKKSPQVLLHLDRGSNFLTRSHPDWMHHPPSAFYNIFVDLYLLAQSRCVAYDLGGYGRWGAALMATNNEEACILSHSKETCSWEEIIMTNKTTLTTTVELEED